MEIKNAAALLQRMADSSGSRHRDVYLSVRIFKPGTIGGTPCVPVKQLDQGFDWDAGRVLITPDVELTTLTAEEVADIRKSVADGQSWHAHQVQKKLRDEHDDCSLAAAAACYILGTDELTFKGVRVWPGRWHFKGPIDQHNYRRALVKGAALALAEIERIDRAADKKGGDQ